VSEDSDRDTIAGPIDPRVFGLTKAAYAVGETLDLLSIGRTSLYAAVKRGDLKRVKFGNKTLFYAADLASFLTKLGRLATGHKWPVSLRRAACPMRRRLACTGEPCPSAGIWTQPVPAGVRHSNPVGPLLLRPRNEDRARIHRQANASQCFAIAAAADPAATASSSTA
jgi:hypothetical protein